MPRPADVFVLFYAVLFGAIFTISDRWRPFAFNLRSREGKRRSVVSLSFYGVMPTAYFLGALGALTHAPLCEPNSLEGSLSLAVALVLATPVVSFHFLWLWRILRRPTDYYTYVERNREPVRSSLAHAHRPASRHEWLFALVFFFVPLLCFFARLWLARIVPAIG